MKHILPFLVLCLIPIGVNAQQPIVISDEQVRIGDNSVPGFSVTIPEVSYEKTHKNWIKELESRTKSDVIEKDRQLTIFGARIKDISDDPVNVYSNLNGVDSALNLQVAFELTKDEYIEKTTASEWEKARTYLMNFAKDQYIDLASEQARTEEKKLRDLEGELKSLERDQERMEKSNRSDYQAIADEKAKLVTLNGELATLSSSISDGNVKISSMTSSGQDSKEESGRLKDMEKQKKKLLNDIESAEKRISKAEKQISENEFEIPKNIEKQTDLRGKVSAQQAVYEKYANKLNTIKDFR